jgi:hypothetical protein
MGLKKLAKKLDDYNECLSSGELSLLSPSPLQMVDREAISEFAEPDGSRAGQMDRTRSAFRSSLASTTAFWVAFLIDIRFFKAIGCGPERTDLHVHSGT